MSKLVNILYAEDNEHDIVATKRAWKQHKIKNELWIVRDGEECMDFLLRREKYNDPESSPKPNLLLLDLNMPKLDGLGVLQEIRKHESLIHLHVVVLTTSTMDEDRIKSYDLGVKGYIMKPVGFESFATAIKSINLYWSLVEPSNGREFRINEP